MFKSLQIKIVLIFMVLGILMLGVQGILFMNNLQQIAQNATGYNEVQNMVVQEANQARNLTIILTITFIIISIVVAAFLIKAIISPMNPNSEPQMERERRMTAGLSPITCPMMRGVR